MDRRAELNAFLRTRRARLTPADLGLPEGHGPRRVPGVRREELAQVAGVSVDYYVRLEQGRARQPSVAVLDSVARTLRLDEIERAHLRNLARPDLDSSPRSATAVVSGRERVRPALQQLLDALSDVPAYVVGRRTDVLAWNSLAAVLLGDFGALASPERNQARLVFLDPAARELYVDWEDKAQDVVAYLRLDAGRHPDDEQLGALVGDLSIRSAEFRRMWATHDVRDKTHGTKRLRHPVVGELTVQWETLRLPDQPDHALITFSPLPASPSATSLALLKPLAAEMIGASEY